MIPCLGLRLAIFGPTAGFATLGRIVTGTLVVSNMLTHSPLGPLSATHRLQKSLDPLLVGRSVLKGRVHQVFGNLLLHTFLLVSERKQCKQLGPEYVMSFDLIRSRLVGLILGQRGEKVSTRNYLDIISWVAQEPRLLIPDDFETRIRTGIPNLRIRLGLLTQLLVDPIVKFVDPACRIPHMGMQWQFLLHKLGRGSPTLLAGQYVLDGIKKELLVPQHDRILAFGLMMGHQMQ